MINLLAALAWDPGFRGILTVAVAVTILCGSVFLILATNNGARLGFMLALTGFAGWMFVLGSIWSMYGIGDKGAAPTWKVVDVVRSEPDSGQVVSSLPLAETLPLPDELPDPVALRDKSAALLKLHPTTQRDPNIGDLVADDTPEGRALKAKINEKVAPWTILETPNKFTGETQAVVSEAVGPDGQNIFPDGPTDYVVVQSFLVGGKKSRTDNSMFGRVRWKLGSIVNLRPPEFYAAVQLQPVIPQTAKPGQAPPTPVRNPKAPIYTVVLKRVQGHLLRRNSFAVTISMGLLTGVLCFMLHRRDKLAQVQRAAVAGAGAA